MKKALLILTTIATLFGCTKSSKNNVSPSTISLPAGYRTVLIIDTSLYCGTTRTNCNNFSMTITNSDTIYSSNYADSTLAFKYFNVKWEWVGGTRFASYYKQTDCLPAFWLTGSPEPGRLVTNLYIQIQDGDTVSNGL